jgi:oligoribonuclease NrnB/cAMP/cGMP phosphodiesterase (DHH superfamily)
MKLNDVIKDEKQEQVILENINRCSNMVGKFFKVIFWHENLSKKECKNFVERNEKLLFAVNTKITKEKTDVWFLINSKNETSNWRYKHDGDILSGISQYIKIIKHLKRKIKNEL